MGPDKQTFRAAQRAFIAERREKVSDLYRAGKTYRQISQELGLSRSVVFEDMQACIAQWQEATKYNIALHISIELEKINHREAAAWAAFERSRQPKRTASAAKKAGLDGETSMASATTTEREEGNPRFLAEIAKCTDQRVKLLRLDQKPAEDSADRNQPKTLGDFVLQFEREQEEAQRLRLGKAPE